MVRMFWGRPKADAPTRHNGDQRNPRNSGRLGTEKHGSVRSIWNPKRIHPNYRMCVNKESVGVLFVNIPVNVNVNVVNIV